MDRYRASIESVDCALSRLNQTLAAYRVCETEGSATMQKTRTEPDCCEPSRPTVENNGRRHLVADVSSPALDAQIRRHVLGLRSFNKYPETMDGESRLRRLQGALDLVRQDPYCMPLHLFVGIEYLGLGYPDLAAGAIYKSLLLSDALDDVCEEYHEVATAALKCLIQLQPLDERIKTLKIALKVGSENSSDTELDTPLDIELTVWLKRHYILIMYRVFIRSLLLCGCLRAASLNLERALTLYPEDQDLLESHSWLSLRTNTLGVQSPADWPDSGLVRREVYSWNSHEPDRLNQLDTLNEAMRQVSDVLEVRAARLPDLAGDPSKDVTQIGLFAKEDILPGAVILYETSLLTANNKLQDALCDACSAELPDLQSEESQAVVQCPECEVVFCSDWCYHAAATSYHPALCDKDVEAIAKDVPPAEAADSLYSLLLLRALAMAETQECHPLDLVEIRFIWGDFVKYYNTDESPYKDPYDPTYCTVPRTLPFSFEHNIRLPYHMLEKMDVDIFANPQYDVWVFNTLYAKFRGTASARLSGLGGRAIRGPEVSAVHPMWCLANHSCDPNVSWEWGGSVKFAAREQEQMTLWKRHPEGGNPATFRNNAGIKKGEEIRNHYCDIQLPVQERREWARGALGGTCQCSRCEWETSIP